MRPPSAANTIAKHLILLSLLLACIALQTQPALAQESIPAGTILPIRLNNSLSLKKSKPGQRITGRVHAGRPTRWRKHKFAMVQK